MHGAKVKKNSKFILT